MKNIFCLIENSSLIFRKWFPILKAITIFQVRASHSQIVRPSRDVIETYQNLLGTLPRPDQDLTGTLSRPNWNLLGTYPRPSSDLSETRSERH